VRLLQRERCPVVVNVLLQHLKHRVTELLVRDFFVAIAVHLIHYLNPDRFLVIARRPTSTLSSDLHLLFLEQGLKLTHLEHAIAVEIDLVEQVTHVLFVDQILVGRTTEYEFLVVNLSVLISVDVLKHLLPVSLVRKSSLPLGDSRL
jgi:hypothetical protein